MYKVDGASLDTSIANDYYASFGGVDDILACPLLFLILCSDDLYMFSTFFFSLVFVDIKPY